jgi:hypothetical protein
MAHSLGGVMPAGLNLAPNAPKTIVETVHREYVS